MGPSPAPSCLRAGLNSSPLAIRAPPPLLRLWAHSSSPEARGSSHAAISGRGTMTGGLRSLQAAFPGTAARATHTDVGYVSGVLREWEGLSAWRALGADRRRLWGDKGPVEQQACCNGSDSFESLAEGAVRVLQTAEPREKIRLSHLLWEKYLASELKVGSSDSSLMPQQPARPLRPVLVPPREVPGPKDSPLPLNVYMLHTLAHIELNAIDLAWDTVARFSELNMPAEFYSDFAHVADDESRHLNWCLQRLEELGYSYGDMVAHNLLWEGAEISSSDVSWRMCVVPMSQEARGLDAGPRLVQKLTGWGDNRSAAIVNRISDEERAHVAVGVKWFYRICEALDEQPEAKFRSIMSRLCPELLSGFFNNEARQAVGLPRSWYDISLYPEDLAGQIANSAGLVLGKPGKRVAPTAAPMSPPEKLRAAQIALLQSRLFNMMEIESATAQG